jgi:hypothetical protein
LKIIAEVAKFLEQESDLDYLSLGYYSTSLFFARDYDHNGSDPLLMSLFDSNIHNPRSDFIDGINRYILDGEITPALNLHFRNALDLKFYLGIDIANQDVASKMKLEKFEYGLKLGLTQFHEWYRDFFREFEPLLSEWQKKRQFYGVTGWDPLDSQYELKAEELRKTCFKNPISGLTDDFIPFFTEPLLQGLYELRYFGDGLVVEVDAHSQYSVFPLESHSTFGSEDFLEYTSPYACISLLDSSCFLEHDHSDTSSTLTLSATKKQLNAINRKR